MNNRRASALLAVASTAALTLVACGSSSSSTNTNARTGTAASAGQSGAPGSSAGAGTPSPTASTAQLSADLTGALKFNVTTLHAKAGRVTLQMANPASSGVSHGISVQGNGVDKDSQIVKPGATVTVTATLKPGTYTFYCPVPGHEAAGMKGTLIVT